MHFILHARHPVRQPLQQFGFIWITEYPYSVRNPELRSQVFHLRVCKGIEVDLPYTRRLVPLSVQTCVDLVHTDRTLLENPPDPVSCPDGATVEKKDLILSSYTPFCHSLSHSALYIVSDISFFSLHPVKFVHP